MARIPIGELLLKQGAIDTVQLEAALAYQRRWGGRLGRSIVNLGFMREEAVLSAVSAQLGVPFVEIGDQKIPPDVLALVPAKVVRARRVLPLARLSAGRRGPVVVAFPDPTDLHVMDEVAFATGMLVEPVLASEIDLEQAIARNYEGVSSPKVLGFSARKDAIELPEDTNPITLYWRGRGGGGWSRLN
jgi:type IV pilus assembly protein PilB